MAKPCKSCGKEILEHDDKVLMFIEVKRSKSIDRMNLTFCINCFDKGDVKVLLKKN